MSAGEQQNLSVFINVLHGWNKVPECLLKLLTIIFILYITCGRESRISAKWDGLGVQFICAYIYSLCGGSELN